MQNAGQQYGQGGVPAHQGAAFGHAESTQPAGGSITSSLRQFRKKDVDKQQLNDASPAVSESHVARVAPHNHYPPRGQDCYRYPPQFPDYSISSQVKYSEISEHQPLQEQISPSVIQKAKGKEYMEVCNMPQPHMKQAYPDHINNQQPYVTDPNLHPHAQYIQKEPQMHPSYKPESQYYPKEAQYQQMTHQMPKYNMAPQMRKYPTENDFLSKLRRIHPTMARSIMSDHHLQESQSSYQTLDQNRMYPQNQRYMNYPSPLQNNHFPTHGYIPPQGYANYPPSCSYTRSQVPPRFPSTNPHERSISPRRGYTDNLPMPPVNYAPIPQRISPNYPQYNAPEYAQHYQHRRGPVAPQEYYPQPCRTTQYLPHQMAQPEMAENRVTVSDSIKQYIENWADEETASEMNQIESNRLCKENIRIRDDQATETVYMINASELQYLENGIPLVTSENGIPLQVASENGQYFLKSGVTIDNATGMVRIVEKSNQVDTNEGTVDRVVNLHIVDPLKPDCMLSGKPTELNQRLNENLCDTNDKSRVIIHQNTVIQPSQGIASKNTEEHQHYQSKVASSLPVLIEPTANDSNMDKFSEDIFKECKKETVDKNCSPINMEQMEEFNENVSVICPLKLLEESVETKEEEEIETISTNDTKLKNMPIIDLLPENLQNIVEDNQDEDEKLAPIDDIQKEETKDCSDIIEDIKGAERVIEEIAEKVDKDNSKNDDQETCNDTTETENKEVIDSVDETKDKITKESTKDEEEQTASDIKEETMYKNNISDNKTEETKMVDIPVKNEGSTNTSAVDECLSVIVSNQSSSNDDEKNYADEAKSSVETPPTVIPEKNINTTVKRSKRIFSVDDIINNIGNKSKTDPHLAERRRSLQITKEFLEKEIDMSHIFIKECIESNKAPSHVCEEEKEERDAAGSEAAVNKFSDVQTDKKEEMTEEEKVKTIETVEEPKDVMINKEIITKENSHTVHTTEERKEDIITKDLDKTCNEEENAIKENDTVKEENIVSTEAMDVTEEEGNEVTKDRQTIDEFKKSEPSCEQENENITETAVARSEEKQLTNREEIGHPIEETREESINTEINPSQCEENKTVPEDTREHESSTALLDDAVKTSNIIEQEVTVEKTNSCDTSDDALLEIQSNSNLKDLMVDTASQNEVQYRNAIRVEENNVLLEIAGELVEITVNLVNGKKVITVVPLSDTTVVDFNDNYETLDTTQSQEPIKPDGERDVEVPEVHSIEEVTAPDSDVIESTSEIIIGLDISLEEEIQLDLEKPQRICTKAAKKCYDNDLQIPSITTSEDITDNNASKSYSPNDKVTSSKEQIPDKPKSEKKRLAKSKDNEASKKRLRRSEDDKSVAKELMKVRKVNKDTKNEEEEFVPFKDLIKARKLKKMRLTQMKNDENISADSTNKLDQEEVSEPDSKTEEFDGNKGADIKLKEVEEETTDNTTTEAKETETVWDIKDNKIESNTEESTTQEEREEKKIEDVNKTNNFENKEEIAESIKEIKVKKVNFGSVCYEEPRKSTEKHSSKSKNYKLVDPRVKPRPAGGILVPSVSELLKENEALPNKKKLSLAEYNNRKRKLASNDQKNKEAKIRKTNNNGREPPDCKLKTDIKKPSIQPLKRFKIERPKSLDDISLFGKPKDTSSMKRKFSLEVTTSKPNHFDWEETQSPKTNLNSQEDTQKRLNEFRGLINNNKSKVVVDVSYIKPKSTVVETSEDEILQNYKDQVDSKLSTLNLQIPRLAKPPTTTINPFSSSETIMLMQRFLKNEKLTSDEMEKIKKIISYKRLMQQLEKIKSPALTNSPMNPSYEIRRTCTEKEVKLRLKKLPEKKRKRFRNLYAESTSESDSDFSDNKKSNGDYSVVQTNTYVAGVPKLIIKRKTEMPVPVVRLQRLDMKLLVERKRDIF